MRNKDLFFQDIILFSAVLPEFRLVFSTAISLAVGVANIIEQSYGASGSILEIFVALRVRLDDRGINCPELG